jgi:hypothetical protein
MSLVGIGSLHVHQFGQGAIASFHAHLNSGIYLNHILYRKFTIIVSTSSSNAYLHQNKWIFQKGGVYIIDWGTELGVFPVAIRTKIRVI